MMMRSIFNGTGYLRADDRCSGGQLEEADLVGCKHCLTTMRKSEWQADGGFCHCCDAPVCGPCADQMPKQGCKPFLSELEKSINEAYRREQNARMLGI